MHVCIIIHNSQFSVFCNTEPLVYYTAQLLMKYSTTIAHEIQYNNNSEVH